MIFISQIHEAPSGDKAASDTSRRTMRRISRTPSSFTKRRRRYPGNTVASTISAFHHESTLIKGIAPNVKIAYSSKNDSCFNQPSANL
jgi:hypothetical protein